MARDNPPPPTRRGRRPDPLIDRKAALFDRLYRRGMTIRQIAIDHGHSYGAVRTRLLAQGTPLREPGPKRKVVAK